MTNRGWGTLPFRADPAYRQNVPVLGYAITSDAARSQASVEPNYVE
jgi:hypothetical protein